MSGAKRQPAERGKPREKVSASVKREIRRAVRSEARARGCSVSWVWADMAASRYGIWLSSAEKLPMRGE